MLWVRRASTVVSTQLRTSSTSIASTAKGLDALVDLAYEEDITSKITGSSIPSLLQADHHHATHRYKVWPPSQARLAHT
jgi:hypothetical protein